MSYYKDLHLHCVESGMSFKDADEFIKHKVKQDLKPEVTPVFFRKFETGEIIAVMPTLLANYGCYMSYMHIGQHGECSSDIKSFTLPADESDYQKLYNELVQIGYTLKIVEE